MNRARRTLLVFVHVNRVFNRGGRAVMQQQAPQPQAPEGGGPELLRLGGFLPDAVARPHIVQ